MVGATKRKLPDVVTEMLRNDPDTSRRVAGDWLAAMAHTMVNNLNLGSSMDKALPIAMRRTMAKFPEVNAMYSSGKVSDLAVKTSFVQWFK